MAIPSASLTSIGEVPYYIPATTLAIPTSTRQIWSSRPAPDLQVPDYVPSSIFLLDEAAQQGPASLIAALKSTVRSWLAKDDVFTVGFLRRLYLIAPNAAATASCFEDRDHGDNLNGLLSGWGTSSVHLLSTASITGNSQHWMSGPYFTRSTGIRPAWRLFADVNEAFMFPVVPAEQNSKRYTLLLLMIKPREENLN